MTWTRARRPGSGAGARSACGFPVWVPHSTYANRHASRDRGSRYEPHPVDTSRVKLPSSVLDLCELIAENCHEVWSVGRISQVRGAGV